jgi:DNA-binding HxlR family transcriptional regulator
VLRNDYEGQSCAIARALEIVGERSTLLIVRDAFLGLRRYDQFQESLGIARNVLTDRLNRLVEEGILDRVGYSERPGTPRVPAHHQGPRRRGHARRLAAVGRQVPKRKATPDHPPQIGQAARDRGVRAQGRRRPARG